eukprot:gene6761-7858_t
MDNSPLSPHIIRLLSKKDNEIIEFTNGKRVPKPMLTSTIPSTANVRAPLVVRGEGLKPFPGMSKFLVVQFIPDASVAVRETVTVGQQDINPCCDKCIVVIVPDIVSGTYNVRVGFNCKKMDTALESDKIVQSLKEEYVWSNLVIVVVEGAKAEKTSGKRPLNFSTSKRKKLKASKGNGEDMTHLSDDLFNTILHGDVEFVRQYVEQRTAETKVTYDFDRRDDDGFTPLHYAVAYNWNGLVDYFLKCNADPNRTDRDGWTPLHWAVKANNMEGVNLLLAFGADQTVPNYSRQYPVEMAHDRGYTHMAATLQGMQEAEYKKSNESFESANLTSTTTTTSGTTPADDANGSNDAKMLAKHGFEPYIMPDTFAFKAGIVDKHNTVKFIQQAEKLGLTPTHRSNLMEAFKSLRTLRYRLFWIMLSNPLFNKFCEWDSDGVHFIVHNSKGLLDVLGLYFGLRGSNSAVDWMSHLARRKSPVKKDMSNNTGGDIWTNLRPDTFNSSTNLEKLKDITSEKKEKGKRGAAAKKETAAHEESSLDLSMGGGLDISSTQDMTIDMTPIKSQMSSSSIVGDESSMDTMQIMSSEEASHLATTESTADAPMDAEEPVVVTDAQLKQLVQEQQENTQQAQVNPNEDKDVDFISSFKSTTELLGKTFPVASESERPRSIEDLIIEYVDPHKKEIEMVPYFRFTEPRDGYTVESFLKKIGRGCDAHIEHFPTWEDLMNANSRKLKHLQVPVRPRKWIVHWVEQWKQGRNPVLISKSKSIAKVNTKKQ